MKNLSEDQKKEAIKLHVSEEFKTFDICYERLNGKMQEPDQRIHLESFLLHARNLFDFLYTEKKNDDILATDFSANYFKHGRDGVPIAKINKQLSHITYARLEPMDLYIKRKKIYETIRDALVEYNKQVPEEYKVDLKTQ
jgi:hypothetical protein